MTLPQVQDLTPKYHSWSVRDDQLAQAEDNFIGSERGPRLSESTSHAFSQALPCPRPDSRLIRQTLVSYRKSIFSGSGDVDS